MTRFARIGPVLFAGILAGCGGAPSTSNPGTMPPHGGDLVYLPQDQGIVEVVQERAVKESTAAKPEVAFYFFQGDMDTPLSPAPTSGTLIVSPKKKVELTPKDGGLVTPPGPAIFKGAGIDGSLSFVVNGETKMVPLGIR